ncbi:CHC2 zinc finger domain-containing protein [Cohnella algarum]|uniref:CHC2 zinc finger domain-containing protein n=1 Tax=Cohnella algarum TaxID=2044859 RepID=UPI0030846C65
MNNGMIPQQAIDEVLKRFEIGETVGRYVHLSKRGKYLVGLCPFHSEKTPSFTVTPEKQIFHCYGCGKSGNVIKFMMEMENETFPEAVKRMAEEAGVPVTWSPHRDESSPASGKRRFSTKRTPTPPNCTTTCFATRKRESRPWTICARGESMTS